MIAGWFVARCWVFLVIDRCLLFVVCWLFGVVCYLFVLLVIHYYFVVCCFFVVLLVFSTCLVACGAPQAAGWVPQDPNKEAGDFGDPAGLGQYNEEFRNKDDLRF